jgi:glycosyltransferase involved in cell wall biosynthesis
LGNAERNKRRSVVKGSPVVKNDLVFIWENFGPIHADRCDATAEFLGSDYRVIGLELVSKSAVYDWDPERGKNFTKVTLFPNQRLEDTPTWKQAYILLRHSLSYYGGTFFFCHYERTATFFVAVVLRLLGHRVIVMNDSKFDDRQRVLWRENAKYLFYLPYSGAIASSTRAKDYLRFLGFKADTIGINYDTMNLARIVSLSKAPLAPDGIPFLDRHFTIIARLVPKKNISLALDAYRIYRNSVRFPRKLYICGSGELESDLRELARKLDISSEVVFTGFVQAGEIAQKLATTLALLLPSIEEQFGNVVIEAQALHVPVILSENCGSRDLLIRSGVNGFVIEPDNAAGLAFFMQLLSDDADLWRRMCLAAAARIRHGDVKGFAMAVASHVGKTDILAPALG